jgi:phosphoglycerate kinase
VVVELTRKLTAAELEALQSALGSADRPTAALIGGAKVSTKLDVLHKVDVLIIGGMANTFLNAQGVAVGKSLCEHDLADTAREIMAKAKGVEVVLPVDVVAKEFKAGAACRTVEADAVEADDMILDVGPASAKAIGERLATCKTML